MPLRPVLVVLALALAGPAAAQAIYPVDRAEILAGARFDLKVEMPASAAGPIEVIINGRSASGVLGKAPEVLPREEGQDHTGWWIRDAALLVPGTYKIEARQGEARAEVRWEVFSTPAPKARNVVLFVGDGLSNAHRVAARMMSRGIREGRYGGELAIDDMEHMALISTAGTDSIITDSANSMTAYTTGHKSCVNALAVYCARNKANTAHPRVETIASIARRIGGKAVGIVTNTDIHDATPSAVVAHTRQRRDAASITGMYLAARPEVILGGGSAGFIASKRPDGEDYLKRFESAGYRLVATADEMRKAAREPATSHLLGLFNLGNMDGALDRRILKKGSVPRFPDQPDLVEQVAAALDVLDRNEKGFVLVVESGLIDKFAHALDWERSVYDTIMLDNAVALAKTWAAPRRDTLIVVVGDHTHPVSIVGTYDDRRGETPRERLAVYQHAGFPAYAAADAEGYPPSVDVPRRLAFTFGAYPDHCDTGRPYLDDPNRPTQAGPQPRTFVANEAACRQPGAARRTGNLPLAAASGVHSAEDVILTATGPGAEAFRGRMDNTAVFRVMTTALGLGPAR